jgi:ankyrin repeat protein
LYHWAVRAKNRELFLAAKKAGTPVAVRDDSQTSALYLAVAAGDPWFTRELLMAGAPVNKSVYSPGDKYADYERVYKGTDDLLAIAVVDGKNLEVVQMLLDAGVNVNTKANVYEQGTALHLAAERGQTEMVEAMIKAGANVNAKDRYNRTPLHNAVLQNRRGVIRALVDAGADVSARDSNGIRPISDIQGWNTTPADRDEIRSMLGDASR